MIRELLVVGIGVAFGHCGTCKGDTTLVRGRGVIGDSVVDDWEYS